MSVIIRKAVLHDTSVLAELSVQARVFHNGLSGDYFADPDPQAEELFLSKLSRQKTKLFWRRKKTAGLPVSCRRL